MKKKIITLICLLFSAFMCTSCGGTRVYILGGDVTIHILNEMGEPFKKEDGSRFEVRNICDSGYYTNIEENELTYILSVSVSGKVITMFDGEDARNREEEILLHKLRTTEGIVILDKNDEYKPKFQYLVNATIVKKTPNNFFGSRYEFEDSVILEKK